MLNVVFYNEEGTIVAVGQMGYETATIDGRPFIILENTPNFDINLTHKVVEGQLQEI